MELSKTYKFEASHVLPKHKGKCSRLHGHSWELVVYVEGEIDEETGFVMDYGDISEAVKPIIEKLDHRHLGQWIAVGYAHVIPTDPKFTFGVGTAHMVPGLSPNFYPSSENLLVWIAEQLLNLPWSKLELNETCTSSCTLTRKEYDDRTVGLGRSRGEEVQQP